MDITLIIMLVGWAICLIWVPTVIYTNKKLHPKALFILFFAEMWERFSFYGMRALLTLYMTKVLFEAMTQEAADEKALAIYGSYTALVYLFPIVGGMIADRFFGFRRAILVGGTFMMLGHFTLAIEGMAFGGYEPLFYLSLALIVVGNGYFKPNISSFLGKFYGTDDTTLKDSAFTLFYMGINVGAFLSTLTCGYVGEQISWHYGFGLAGIGMLAGLLVFWFNQKAMGDKGYAPDQKYNTDTVFLGMSTNSLILLLTALVTPIFALTLNYNEVLNTALLVIGAGVFGYLIWYGVASGDKVEGQRLWVVVVLALFNIVFWALFEQAGGSLTLFTDRNVDRVVFGAEIPASVFQSLNPLYIILLAPLFAGMWKMLGRVNAEPSTPLKFVLGLAQLALGFAMIVLAAAFFSTNGVVPLIFLALMYLFHTTGELSLSPVGLSMVSKLSPGKIVGFCMGAYFLSFSLANKAAGMIGQLTATEDIGKDVPKTETLAAYSDVYLIWGVYVPLGVSLFLLVLTPKLRKWMHGIH